MRLFTFFLPFLLITTLGAQVADTTLRVNKDFSGNSNNREIYAKYNININLTDSTDINRLDSLITQLDSIIQKQNPKSDIYGHNLFEGDSLRAYIPGEIVAVPEDYILGVHDKIAISIFGASQYDGEFDIDQSGSIRPEGLTRIQLKGLKWGEAKQLLKRRFGNYYVFKAEQMSATVIRPRMITVNILGEVNRPGSYRLEASNTAFNALLAAGGINDKGSVRNIKVVHGSNSKTLDLYDLINNPSSQFDFYLVDNVIIQVPPYGKLVTVEGAIERPMRYELKGNEGLRELIDYAGGLAGNAVTSFAQLQRNTNDQLTLLDVPLKDVLEQGRNITLQKGDEVLFKSISDEIQDVAIVEGAVQLPGPYSLTSGAKVSDVVNKAVLKKEALLESSFVLKMNADSTFQLIPINLINVLESKGGIEDLELGSGDKIIIPSQSTYTDKLAIKVSGGVRAPYEEAFDQPITLNQAILLAGGLQPDAAEMGYIIRTNPSNRKEKEYIRVNIAEAVINGSSSSNVELLPLDELKVLIATDATDDEQVAIRGAVRTPGEYPFDESLSVSDLLILSDGLLPEASGIIDIYRLQIDGNNPTKIITHSTQVDREYNIVNGDEEYHLQPNDEVVVRTYTAFEKQQFVKIVGEVNQPGSYALINEQESVSTLINRAGGVTGNSNLDGAYIMRSQIENYEELDDELFDSDSLRTKIVLGPDSYQNQLLQKDDILYIPKLENEVYINLANTRAYDLYATELDQEFTIGVPFTRGKSAKWYINNYAGGFTDDANRGSVTVLHANGGVSRTGGFLFRKFPKASKGASIFIGSQIEEEEGKSMSRKGSNKGVIINLGEKENVELKSIK